MWASLAKHWFLIALGVCFAIGYFAHEPLKPLLGYTYLRSGIVFAVMWGMGVTLKADAIRQSLARPLPTVIAIAINIVAVPVLSLPAMWLLPDHLFGGLFIATIIPCTLASASVWTRKAGGDDSIALMTTVVTNLACVFVVPIGIALVLSQQANVSAIDQMLKLAIVVVAPLLLAQLMRRIGCADWADRNKIRISFFAQFGILAMVIIGAVTSASFVGNANGGGVTTSWLTGATLVAVAAAIHLAALYLGIGIARSSGSDRSAQIAVGIAGSQKTLMVGLQIAIDCGVSVVPMLIYHLSQLTIDTLIAERWKSKSMPEHDDE